MFSLNPKPTFDDVVEIPVPGSDPAKLEVTFKHMPRNEYSAFMASVGNGEREEIDALLAIIVGWKNVDEDFSRDALEKLHDNYPGASLAIIKRYTSAMLHGRVKN